ncbi:MAG: universal stress protein [Cyclobacteriaceae bacterium]|nr:universal stress protein [Cyclobacteriaceae bacterium HetDA_MAG_MS6]
MEVKNILVPVDFSSCSKNALKIAIAVAKKVGAKIHMVNAVHVHTPHPDLAGGSLIESIVGDYEAQVKLSFDELESELIELKDVPHDADRFVSYLTDAIYTEAETKDIDLIIMGTREEHEEMEHLLGTHATDIIGSSNVPVLVIPENYKDFNPKRIGFASDFSKIEGYGTLDILNWFAKTFDSEVLVFHVIDDASKISLKEQREVEEICDQLSDIPSSVRTIEYKSIAKGIMEFSGTHQLDTLAMLPRKHNLFERLFRRSITKSVAIDIKIPLLAFHED